MFTIIGADGKEYGPVATAKVREWISAGRANTATQCRREGETAWSTVGSLPEFSDLFAAGGAAGASAPLTGLAGTPGFTGDASLAPRESRLAAAILDSLLTLAVFAPSFGLMFLGGAFEENGPENEAYLVAGGLLFLVAALALIVTQLYLLTTHGQSVGKRVMKIRIVRHADGARAGFFTVILARSLLPGVIGAIPFVGSIFTLVNILFIFREDRRCLHDLIAGTKVVRA